MKSQTIILTLRVTKKSLRELDFLVRQENKLRKARGIGEPVTRSDMMRGALRRALEEGK